MEKAAMAGRLRLSVAMALVAAAVALALMAVPGPRSRAAPAAQRVDVTVGDNFFAEKSITITAGTTVVWTHTGNNSHTVTDDPCPPGPGPCTFDSGAEPAEWLQTGDVFQFTFAAPGIFSYYCRIHGAAGGIGMAGTITVVAAETPTPTPAATPSPATSPPPASPGATLPPAAPTPGVTPTPVPMATPAVIPLTGVGAAADGQGGGWWLAALAGAAFLGASSVVVFVYKRR